MRRAEFEPKIPVFEPSESFLVLILIIFNLIHKYLCTKFQALLIPFGLGPFPNFKFFCGANLLKPNLFIGLELYPELTDANEITKAQFTRSW